MHDSNAFRFRQRAGSAKGSESILRLLSQPPPPSPSSSVSRPPRGSYTVTCRTATRTFYRVNTVRRSRPRTTGDAEPAPAPSGHPPRRRTRTPRCALLRPGGQTPPTPLLRPQRGSSEAAPSGTGSPRERRPRPPRPPAPSVTPWTPHRQSLRRSGSGAFPLSHMLRGELLQRSQRWRQPKREKKKKSFQLMISLGTGEGGGGGGL